MRKITMYAVATLLVLSGVGGWIASTTPARVEAATSVETIDPMRIMMNASRDLPTAELTDYTFVFEHPASR
jgi:hypothetical protein